MIDRTLSVAPMMDWTDRHDRFFLRQISRRALLYTEMVTPGAILYGDRRRFLEFDQSEHPVALQLGGSDPQQLATAARIGEDFGYDEINLNVGCPSDRVQNGSFGACLMARPDLVGDCIQAMQQAVLLPVTVKCRIGIDDQDSFDALLHFIDRVHQSGCTTFIIHARKAWLSGLSPKENREIPPLQYEKVFALKAQRPDLVIILNGGITDIAAIPALLNQTDGVMIGRAAYQDPYILAAVDTFLFAQHTGIPTRRDIVGRFIPYITARLQEGVPLHHMTRHILGLYNGTPGARSWRRHLSEEARKPGAGLEVLIDALGFVERDSAGEEFAA